MLNYFITLIKNIQEEESKSTIESNHIQTSTDETYGAKVLPTCVPFPLPECHWCKCIIFIDVTYWTI